MKPQPERTQEDEDLSPVMDRFEKDVSKLFRNAPEFLWTCLVVLLLLVFSPLAVFWFNQDTGKAWSEVVKNIVEALALIAAAFAVFKWIDERRNRATDVLLKLEDEFKKQEVAAARDAIEAGDYAENGTDLDPLLRFYIVLYGVYRARQVPEVPLSICFRYWLAHYYRKDRPEFRRYVRRNYPTLTHWLDEDCRRSLAFFRPHQLFRDKMDEAFISECLRKTEG